MFKYQPLQNTPRPSGTPLQRGIIYALKRYIAEQLKSPLLRGDLGVCLNIQKHHKTSHLSEWLSNAQIYNQINPLYNYLYYLILLNA